jgi:hypothetical protein
MSHIRHATVAQRDRPSNICTWEKGGGKLIGRCPTANGAGLAAPAETEAQVRGTPACATSCTTLL